jgi:hypothetical protein
MKQLIKPIRFVFFLLLSFQFWGQQTKNDSIVRQVRICHQSNANQIKFTANAPQLRQIAGAPKAYYSNFWEFGDGHYSRKNNPTHTYKNKGEYTVRLAATNNYDDGLPPTSRPQKVKVTDVSSTDFDDENKALIDRFHGFRLLNNREPSPDQEMQFVLRYANSKSYTTQGELYVFYNEKKFKKKNFNLVDVRTYYGEKSLSDKEIIVNNQTLSLKELVLTSGIQSIYNQFIEKNDTIEKHNLPATLQNAKEAYQDYRVWKFDNLAPNETRNLFMTFKTTPEMLKDTSAVISIRSIFVPERGGDTHQVRTKEMEIVTSHDPNKMAVYNTLVNYRFMRHRRLKYKVRFQNNGEGPARLIKLNVDIPDMLDKSSLKVIDMYPKVPICPDGESVNYSCLDTVRSKDMISFQFKNIYLPGSNQKGVFEKDSTKGFVKYSLKFGKNFHKKPSISKTAIIFDKNEPIITNVATSRFSTGLSVGVRAGYNHFFTKDITQSINIEKANSSSEEITGVIRQFNTKSYFTGLTFSPYKSYKWYWQSELYLDHLSNTENYQLEYRDEVILIVEDAEGATHEEAREVIVRQDYLSKTAQTNMLLVPTSIRYNLNSFFALGSGVQINLRLKGTATSTTNKVFFEFNPDQPDELGKEITGFSNSYELGKSFGLHLYDYQPFVDFTAGLSRIGPSLGMRYLFPIKQKTGALQFYAIWKF